MIDFRFNWFTCLWITWVIVGIVIQIVALLRNAPHDTLSEHVWWLMSRRPFWVWVIGGFLAWLLVHWLSRGRWG